MKKIAFFSLIVFGVVVSGGVLLGKEVQAFFLNHPSNKAIDVRMIKDSKIVKTFSVAPGEFAKADGDWKGYYVDFSGQVACNYNDELGKSGWSELSARGEYIYRIDEKYKCERYGGHWGEWTDFDGKNVWEKYSDKKPHLK